VADAIRPGRLFFGSCTAVTALAFTFAAMSAVMYQLKLEFRLDNAQVGMIGGAGLWGMAISQISFSSLTDVLGMRNLLRLAVAGHVVGVGLFVFATGFSSLFAAALLIAVANGMIEAVCNPLTATLFPDRKAGMLNRMHMWFPGGIVLGGLGCWALDEVHADWRAKMIMVLIPALAYGLIFLREKFPPTEAAAAGHTLADAFKAVATSPLLWAFLALMTITMSLELGPNRWIPAVLQAGGLPGILVLVMINGVMAITRANAHAILARVSPPMVLMVSTAVAGLGLLGLSYSVTPAQAVFTALVFAIGISIVWPTMMGFVAERTPRTGALGLGLRAAAGSLAVGLVTTPLLGEIADTHLPDALAKSSVVSVATQVLILQGPKTPEIVRAAQAVATAPDALPPPPTGDLLRRAAAGEAGPVIAKEAQPLLDAGENHSGLLSFRYLVPFAFGVCLIFGLVVLSDRRAGGYKAQVDRARLSAAE
jgi:MFS family permease